MTEDDVDKADRFFDVMAPRWCSSAGLLRGWKRGVNPGGGFGYGPAPLHRFHGGGLGGVNGALIGIGYALGSNWQNAQSYTRYFE